MQRFYQWLLLALFLGLGFGVGFVLNNLRARGMPAEGTIGENSGFIGIDRRTDAFEKNRKPVKFSFYKTLTDNQKTPYLTMSGTAPQGTGRVVSEAVSEMDDSVKEESSDDESQKPPSNAEVQKPTQERIAEALAKALGNEVPGSVHNTVKSLTPPTTGSAFAVQVASFPEVSLAESALIRLKAKGYQARVVRGELSEGKTVYRIRIGGFSARQDADSFLREFESREKTKGLVIAESDKLP